MIPLLLALLFFLVAVYYYRNFRYSRRREAESLHREAETKNFLNIFSQNIRDTDDIGRSMMATARYVADLCEAQAVCIYKADQETDHHRTVTVLKVLGFCGAYPPMTRLNYSGIVKPKFILDSLRRERIMIGEGIIGRVARDHEPILLEDAVACDELREVQPLVPIQTLMAMPLVDDDNIIGVICAINNKRNNRAFSNEQFHRFRFIAKQILIAINITQVYSSLAEQHRIAQELSFARKLQASLLPSRFPGWKKYEFYNYSRPAKEVSGDFYDFVPVDDHRLLAIVGDVCGKGIPACIVMSMTRTFIRSYINHFTSLRELLEEVNNSLVRDTDDEMYVTLACCLIDSEKNTVEFARAGHTGMLLNVRHHNRIIYPDGPGLGLMPSEYAEFDTLTLQFTPGVSILLFTDGISEASNDEGEEFGIKRIGEIFERVCAEGEQSHFTEKILSAVDAFSGGEEDIHQEDDQTVVLIHLP